MNKMEWLKHMEFTEYNPENEYYRRFGGRKKGS